MLLLRYILISVFTITALLASNPTFGQDTIRVSISNATGEVGDRVCVDVTVTEFENVGSFFLEVTFNPNIVQFDENIDVSNSCLNDPTQTLSTGNFNGFNDTGQVKVIWSSGAPVTLVDGCILFTLCFDIVGLPGDCTPIVLDGSATEFTDFDTLEDIPSVLQSPGSIKVTSPELVCREGHCNPSPGNNDGSIYFWAVSGSGPYTYTVNGTPGLNTIVEYEEVPFDNLPTGMYNIIITDNLGESCSMMINMFESSDYPFSMTIDGTDPTCFDKENGTAFIASTMGGSPVDLGPGGEFIFNTEWSNGDYNVDEITKLLSGEYFVTVTDFNGCRLMDSITINADTLYVFAEVISTPTCNGSDDGTIKVTAQGGSPGPGGVYTFAVEGQDVFYNQEITGMMGVFGGMSNGMYEITARDDNGIPCFSDIITVSFDEDPNFTADIFFDVDPCEGGCTRVKILPTIDGLNLPTFVDESGTTLSVVTGTLNDTIISQTELCPGRYDVTIENFSLGCFLDTFFVISDINPLQVSVDSVAPSCSGSDGSITVNASGGAMPYTFTWNIDAMDGNTREMLGGGEYKVTVTDLNGCQDSVQVTFISDDMIPLDVFIQQAISCSGANNGVVGATVTGSNDFTFSWSDGTNDLGSDPIQMNLGTGTYYVTATDSQGCSTNDSVFLAEPMTDLSVTVTQSGPSCASSNDGLLFPVGMGGQMPYTYVWKNSVTMDTLLEGEIFTGTVGDYILCITDALGCSTDTLLTMELPANAITVDISNIMGVSCYNECSGQATVLAMGGDDPASGYIYRVNGSIVGNSTMALNLTGLCPGTNWVIASDVSCASDTFFFEIDNQPEVGTDEALNELVNPLCLGDSNGSIEVILQGTDINDASLLWLGQGTVGPSLVNISAGEYILEISYGQGCTVNDTFNLVDPEELFVNIDPFGTNGVSCNDGNTGRIQLNVVGGSGGDYVYQWSPDVSDTNIATMLTPGFYEITVTDGGGCSEEISYTLDSAPPVTAVIPSPEPPSCNGEQTCILVESASGGVGNNYTFSINNGPRIQIDTCVNLFAGDYLITVFDSVGCSFDTTVMITQPDELSVTVGPDQSLNLGEISDPISVQPVSTLPIESFAWSPIDFLEFQNPEQQIAIASPQQTTLYTVTVTDENGCTATDDVLVEVEFRRNVYRPNVFSPNGDEVNDNFQLVVGFGVEEVISFSIFDRWGTKVYNEMNYMPNDVTNPGWNGEYKGQQLAPGVYVFVAKVRFDDSAIITYSGDVTLVR